MWTALAPRTDECPVKRLVECRDLFHPLKSFLRVIRFQVFNLTGFKADAVGGLMAVRVTRRVVDLHFIEARGQRLNLSQALQDRPVLQTRHPGGDKMPRWPTCGFVR